MLSWKKYDKLTVQIYERRLNMGKYNFISKEAISKLDDVIGVSKLNDFLRRKEDEDKRKDTLIWVLAIVGTVAFIAAIAYLVYKFVAKSVDEDYEDFDEDFDDDFFDEDEVRA